MLETILERVADQVKIAMKARDRERLAALRLMMAEFKRVEVDEQGGVVLALRWIAGEQ